MWADSMQDLNGPGIYVLMTSSDYIRFRVGRTGGNPLNRERMLRVGDSFLAMAAAYFVPRHHGQLSKIEQAMHDEFGGPILVHDESEAEWFIGTLTWACEWIEVVFEGSWSVISGAHTIGWERVSTAYDWDLMAPYGRGAAPLSVVGLPL